MASAWRIARDAKAEIVEAQRRIESIATGAADEAPRVVPASATRDTRFAVSVAGPRATVTRRKRIRVVPAVVDPLPHVAEHVIQAKRIRRETPARRGLQVVPDASASVAVGAIPVDAVAPIAHADGSGARRVLPLRFRREAEPSCCGRIEPAHVLLRV